MSFELVETVEVGSGGAASIEFTSIPQDGTDLVLKTSIRTNRAFVVEGGSPLSFNNSTGNVYSWLRFYGTGSTVDTSSDSGASSIYFPINGANSTSNTFTNAEHYISNYTSSSVKSVSCDLVTENNDTFSWQFLLAANTSGSGGDLTDPITSIKITAADLYVEGTTASLYKITAA